jgi:hypothetical protein
MMTSPTFIYFSFSFIFLSMNSTNEDERRLDYIRTVIYFCGMTFMIIYHLVPLVIEFYEKMVSKWEARKYKHIDFTMFEVNINFNRRIGTTTWTNHIGHPFVGYDKQIGPFKFLGEECTTANTFPDHDYITLSIKPGESTFRSMKSAAKRINAWNIGLSIVGSPQQKAIMERFGENKDLIATLSIRTKFKGVRVVGDGFDHE